MNINITQDTNCDKFTLPIKDRERLSREQAMQMTYYMGIFSGCAILASLFTGSWSDSIGRKPSMMLPSLLGIPAEILFALASFTLTKDWSLILVYFAAFFNGISGGTATFFSSCFGYIADVTNTENRTKRLTFLEACIFIGGFIGYNLAGILMQYVLYKHYEYAFAFNLILHVVIVIYVNFCLKETRGKFASIKPDDCRPQEPDANLASVGLFSFNHVSSMFRTIFKKRPSRLKILLLCLCSICSFYAMSVQLTLTFSFVKSTPINWTSSTYSYYSGFGFMAGGLSLLIILPFIYHWKPHIPDKVIGCLGLSSKGIGLLNLGLAKTSEQVFLGVGLFSFGEYTMPALRSMLSKAIETHERGKAFSFLGLLQNISSFTGSLFFPPIYASSQAFFPGLAFEVTALAQFLALIILILAF